MGTPTGRNIRLDLFGKLLQGFAVIAEMRFSPFGVVARLRFETDAKLFLSVKRAIVAAVVEIDAHGFDLRLLCGNENQW